MGSGPMAVEVQLRLQMARRCRGGATAGGCGSGDAVIARRHFFIREKVEDGDIVVPFVKSAENLADFFTKPLPPKVFFAMRDAIMNVKN